MVTENVADFAPLADDFDQRGRGHCGLVFIDSAKFPRGQRRTIGRLVKELDKLIASFPNDEAVSIRHWL